MGSSLMGKLVGHVVIKSVTLKHRDAPASGVLYVERCSDTSWMLYDKVESLSGLPKSLLSEGSFFSSEILAIQALESHIQGYMDAGYDVIDEDAGCSFPTLLSVVPERPSFSSVAELSKASSCMRAPMVQFINGGLRVFVHVDPRGEIKSGYIKRGQLVPFSLDAGAAVFIRDLARQAQLLNGLFEAWVNRSSITITDVVYRTAKAIHVDGPLLMRLGRLQRILPRSFYSSSNSRIEIPRKLEEVESSFVNLGSAFGSSPVGYLRDQVSSFTGCVNAKIGVVFDGEGARDSYVLTHDRNLIVTLAGESEQLIVASPILTTFDGGFFISGLKDNDKVRPLLF